MKKMNMITKAIAPTAVLLATSLSLAAQEGEPMKSYVSLGQNIAQNHSLTLAGKPWGGPGCYHAEFGLEFYHPATTLLVRPNVGYTRILSDPAEPQRDKYGFIVIGGLAPTVYDLLGVFIGFDLVYNVSKKLPITVTAGPSFHSWSVEQSNNVGRFNPDNPNEVSPGPATMGMQGERALKLGWRTGIGYGFKEDKFRVDFTYTMTEWRSRNTEAYREAFNPSLPSYFTLKASYTF
jgi:hypothetical protein